MSTTRLAATEYSDQSGVISTPTWSHTPDGNPTVVDTIHTVLLRDN